MSSNKSIVRIMNVLHLTIIVMTLGSYAHAFSIMQKSHRNLPSSSKSSSSSSLQMAPGGWGIGTPLDFQDEEYSSNSSSKRRRRRRRKDSNDVSSNSSGNDEANEVAYNAETTEKIAKVFSMEDSQQFSQRIQQERNNLQLQKQKDLMEIAKIAGLGDRLKPKVNNVNDAGFEDFAEFDLADDDDDDLDVRVQLEED